MSTETKEIEINLSHLQTMLKEHLKDSALHERDHIIAETLEDFLSIAPDQANKETDFYLNIAEICKNTLSTKFSRQARVMDVLIKAWNGAAKESACNKTIIYKITQQAKELLKTGNNLSFTHKDKISFYSRLDCPLE